MSSLNISHSKGPQQTHTVWMFKAKLPQSISSNYTSVHMVIYHRYEKVCTRVWNCQVLICIVYFNYLHTQDTKKPTDWCVRWYAPSLSPAALRHKSVSPTGTGTFVTPKGRDHGDRVTYRELSECECSNTVIRQPMPWQITSDRTQVHKADMSQTDSAASRTAVNNLAS